MLGIVHGFGLLGCKVTVYSATCLCESIWLFASLPIAISKLDIQSRHLVGRADSKSFRFG